MKVPYIIGPNEKKYITHKGVTILLKRAGGSMKPKTSKKNVGLRNSRGILFCIGDVVALRENAFKTSDPHPNTFAGRPITKARITTLLPGRDKSVQLDKKLGGYWTWSVEELRKVKVKNAA